VRREVIEVVTPGLVGDPEGLEASSEVAVAALWAGADGAGLAAFDASTGRFRATAVESPGGGIPAVLLDELERVAPREVLVARGAEDLADAVRARLKRSAVTALDPASFEPGAAPPGVHGFDATSRNPDQRAAAAVLSYVAAHQPSALAHAPRLRRYGLADAMVLDAATRSHLELFENGSDRSRRGTLIERVDRTVTPLGARRLARWLAYPLVDVGAIRARQDAVEALAGRDRPRARLRDALARVRDLERLFAKVARPGAEPRDLAALRASVEALPEVSRALAEGDEEWLPGTGRTPAVLPVPAPVPEVGQLLAEAIVDEPRPLPRGSRGAGQTGYIREGFRSELDALRDSARKGREWIAGLEARERERVGVSSLKVRFHPVHGYSLELTKSNLDRVPDDYERKQTLANAERFTTPELREMESKVLGASDRAAALERKIFEDVRRGVIQHAGRLAAAAEAVGELDALQSLAEVGRRDGWVRPRVESGEALEIRGGRHPVVESMLRARGEGDFVPNDAVLDAGGTRILLITGPNMSGKSTYLRQVALLVLLAQMGSFVPAESARIGIVDRVFTRVGASDRLAEGESTFMVEMRETADILSQASPASLIILDEIGRGTSTFDGLSIAWAVAEYLHDTPGLGARTLFATHYHELADLARTRAGVRNGHFEAREFGEDVVFLRRLVPGEASRSYGIQVARLAGLPAAVIGRARDILRRLEGEALSPDGRPRLAADPDGAAAQAQLGLFGGGTPREAAEEEVLEALRGIDPERTTPLEALGLLADWTARLRREDAE
jgi:DNA mismatch repair protein MutS